MCTTTLQWISGLATQPGGGQKTQGGMQADEPTGGGAYSLRLK
jgi:hypothetical protein